MKVINYCNIAFVIFSMITKASNAMWKIVTNSYNKRFLQRVNEHFQIAFNDLVSTDDDQFISLLKIIF